MNTTLHYYTPEILDISKENHVGYKIACDMFMNNINDVDNFTDQYHYAGADQVDYVELAKTFPEEGTEEYTELKRVWQSDYQANQAQIAQLNADGDDEGIRNLMMEAAKSHE